MESFFSVDQTQARSVTGSSGSARSVLPPVSPTSSRYWDHDRDGTTSRSTVGSTSSALTSSSLKHSTDDGYKSAASATREEKSEGEYCSVWDGGTPRLSWP